jgi:hypothetical protein
MGLNPMSSCPNAIWITWLPHRRTESICEALGVPLIVFDNRHLGRVRRRILQISQTFRRLITAKEQIVFVQNPSLGLSVVACIVRKFRRFRLVIDAHNEGIIPFNRSGLGIALLTRWIVRTADLTIVTNEELEEVVTKMGGVPSVLPDPLPNFGVLASDIDVQPLSKRDYVFVICTYASDEPIEEMLSAACRLSHSVDFVFTGNREKGLLRVGRSLPENVRLSGYLPEAQFINGIVNSLCVLDLTLKPHCLVCGAYEALTLTKPAILTWCPAAERLFGAAFELIDNSSDAIVDSVSRILGDPAGYVVMVRELADAYRTKWKDYERQLLNCLCGLRVEA